MALLRDWHRAGEQESVGGGREAVAWGRWRGIVYNGRQGGLQWQHVGDAAGGLKRQMPINDNGDYDIMVKRANEKFICKT
jgi:hypothetical protein